MVVEEDDGSDVVDKEKVGPEETSLQQQEMVVVEEEEDGSDMGQQQAASPPSLSSLQQQAVPQLSPQQQQKITGPLPSLPWSPPSSRHHDHRDVNDEVTGDVGPLIARSDPSATWWVGAREDVGGRGKENLRKATGIGTCYCMVSIVGGWGE